MHLLQLNTFLGKPGFWCIDFFCRFSNLLLQSIETDYNSCMNSDRFVGYLIAVVSPFISALIRPHTGPREPISAQSKAKYHHSCKGLHRPLSISSLIASLAFSSSSLRVTPTPRSHSSSSSVSFLPLATFWNGFRPKCRRYATWPL